MKHIITLALCVLLSFSWNGERMAPLSNNQPEKALKAFCGKFSIVAPSAIENGGVYNSSLKKS